jgi:hypothetical protein
MGFGRWLGRVRDECRNVPPVRPARFTISSDSSWTFPRLSASLSGTRSTRPAQPRRIPSTRYPSRSARIVMARMAGFSPGTSPPPVRIPIVPLLATVPLPRLVRRPPPTAAARCGRALEPSAPAHRPCWTVSNVRRPEQSTSEAIEEIYRQTRPRGQSEEEEPAAVDPVHAAEAHGRGDGEPGGQDAERGRPRAGPRSRVGRQGQSRARTTPSSMAENATAAKNVRGWGSPPCAFPRGAPATARW